MKFSAPIFLALAGAVFVAADRPMDMKPTDNPDHIVYETITTTAITTYCPESTTIIHGDKTYTVTEATTLTITDCPCTITRPVCHTCHGVTKTYTSCSETKAPETPCTTGATVVPECTTCHTNAPVPECTTCHTNAPVPECTTCKTNAPVVTTTTPCSTCTGASTTKAAPSQFTGAADKHAVGGAVGLFAIVMAGLVV